MRWLLVLIVVIVPAITHAKPSVAVAPFEGDDKNKVANAVEKVLEREASLVIGHKETGRAMSKLGLSGKLEKADKKKLRKRLEVDVLVEGKVEDKQLELRISGKGVKTSRFKIEFKSATSPKLKSDLETQLGKRLSPAKSDEDEEEVAKPAETERPKRKKKVVVEEDEGGDDDGGKVRKKRKKRRDLDDEADGGDDEAAPAGRHMVTQAAIRANVGAGVARRTLSYNAAGNQAPPPVGTAAPTARVEIEAYPAAMETLAGPAAGFGVYGHFDRALALSIDVPGGGNTPIAQQHYGIGVRYRFTFGQHAVALGLGYAGRSYVADRSGLAMNQTLDMPDTSYGAISPNLVGRFAVTPTVGLFFGGDIELLMKAGQITDKEALGYAKTFGFGVTGGADIAFTPRYGLRLATEFNQVGFTFSKPKRGVAGAADRTLAFGASFEVLY